jgi:hypothetical protein
MADFFRDFIEAEVHSMLEEMGDDCRNDPLLRREKALDWIERNAADFRINWDKRHAEAN